MVPAGGRPAILVVCTGNICRSPAVELLLRERLGAHADVSSAGTGALVGEAISPPMAALLADAGIDASGFAASQLTAERVRAANLVIALTRAHRSAAVRLAPAAVRKTFTLRELAHLLATADLDGLPDGGTARLEEVLGRARAARTRPGARLSGADVDVVDPYRGDDSLYRTSWAQLAPPSRAITDALLLASGVQG